MIGLYNILDTVLNMFAWAIIIRYILTWFAVSPNNPVSVFLFRLTEPILAPLRRYIPRVGMLDLTPFVAFLLLRLVISPLLKALLT